jgi:hypothetical protein
MKHLRSVIAGVHGEKIMKVRQTQCHAAGPVRPNPRAFRTPRNSSARAPESAGRLARENARKQEPRDPTSSDGSETSIYQ